MLASVPSGDQIIALDVLGKEWSTEQLAENIDGWSMSGVNLSFLIGGPDGLSQQCLQVCDRRWSLSALTLPHPLVRVILVEQFYRAASFLQGHPYHK